MGHSREDASGHRCLRADPSDSRFVGWDCPRSQFESEQSSCSRRGFALVADGFGALRLGDNKILERVFAVYDAPYAECKRRTVKA
jgi:hypothetical protein